MRGRASSQPHARATLGILGILVGGRRRSHGVVRGTGPLAQYASPGQPGRCPSLSTAPHAGHTRPAQQAGSPPTSRRTRGTSLSEARDSWSASDERSVARSSSGGREPSELMAASSLPMATAEHWPTRGWPTRGWLTWGWLSNTRIPQSVSEPVAEVPKIGSLAVCSGRASAGPGHRSYPAVKPGRTRPTGPKVGAKGVSSITARCAWSVDSQFVGPSRPFVAPAPHARGPGDHAFRVGSAHAARTADWARDRMSSKGEVEQ